MYLLIAVINNEDVLGELITGWLDIGITDSIIVETTDSIQMISHHIPIFAGFRSLTSGGMRHNKTILTVLKDQKILDLAVSFLEKLCRDTGKSNQGTYLVVPVQNVGRLGVEENI